MWNIFLIYGVIKLICEPHLWNLWNTTFPKWERNMEHCKALSAAMVGRQEQYLNFRRSRMAKVVTFWCWWQPFNSFCFETILFPCFPFFLCLYKKGGGHRPLPPPPPSSVVRQVNSSSIWVTSLHRNEPGNRLTYCQVNSFIEKTRKLSYLFC